MLRPAIDARGSNRPDCPDGFSLPGLDALLTPSLMLGAINDLLPSSRSSYSGCTLVNLRYKTATSGLVTYRLTRPRPDGAGDEETYVYARGYSRPQFEMAKTKIPTTRWVDSADGPGVSLLPDVATILYWYPNDERLHGLRRITVNKKLQRVFYNQLSDYPPDEWRISDRSIRLQVVRYKPERRAVIRCRFRAHRHADDLRQERFVYLGVYEDGRDRYLGDLLQALHQESAKGGWMVPKPLAWISEHSALVIDTFEGVPLQEILTSAPNAAGTNASLQAAATALARLHTVSLPSVPAFSLNQALQQIGETREMLARFAPELEHDVTQVAATLANSMRSLNPQTGSFVHGDLHAKQIIVNGDSIGFLDFDRAQMGDPAQDLGNFRAQLWLNTDTQGDMMAEKIAQSFIEQYTTARGARLSIESINIWTAVSLFHSALRPIGRMEDSWRQRVQSILNLTGATLQ